jgi:hypothetical protein
MIHVSCLCGGVRFEFPRAVTPVWMCHCSLCRKVSGAASNASFLVPEDEFVWRTGEDLLQTFAMPAGWRTAFCRSCGSKLPQLHPSGGAYAVPAGLLDDDPGVRAGAHIYVGSKAPWDEIGGSAPRFDEGLLAPETT